MKFLDLLKRVKAMLEEVPEKHTGEVTMKFQLNQGGVRDSQLTISKTFK